MSLKKCHSVAELELMCDGKDLTTQDIINLWLDRENKIEQIAKLKKQLADAEFKDL